MLLQSDQPIRLQYSHQIKLNYSGITFNITHYYGITFNITNYSVITLNYHSLIKPGIIDYTGTRITLICCKYEIIYFLHHTPPHSMTCLSLNDFSSVCDKFSICVNISSVCCPKVGGGNTGFICVSLYLTALPVNYITLLCLFSERASDFWTQQFFSYIMART